MTGESEMDDGAAESLGAPVSHSPVHHDGSTSSGPNSQGEVTVRLERPDEPLVDDDPASLEFAQDSQDHASDATVETATESAAQGVSEDDLADYCADDSDSASSAASDIYENDLESNGSDSTESQNDARVHASADSSKNPSEPGESSDSTSPRDSGPDSGPDSASEPVSDRRRPPDSAIRTAPGGPAVGPDPRRASGARMRPPRPPAGTDPRKPAARNELALALQMIQGLTGRISNLETNTQKIARALVEIVKEGDNRKKAYDVLYDEMRQYKEDFLWKAQKPLFLDLIGLFDSMMRVEKKYEETQGMESVVEDFRYLKEALLETLYRYDVELIDDHPDRLDISFQKPIKRVDTDSPEDDKLVVQYVREGFTRDNTVLRPQEIVVKRFSEARE